MKLSRFYDLVVKLGEKKDPRTKKEIAQALKRARHEYKGLKGVDKTAYDMDMLKHPYADTRILCGNPDKEIKTMMVGIDMETPELLLADRLIEKGLAIDLALSHHPEGLALANFFQVMHIHKNLLMKAGLKKEIVESLMEERIKQVSRSISPVNHTRSVEAARFLDIAFMCAHTPADNHVADYLKTLFERLKPNKVKDVLGILKTIPEFRMGMNRGAGPKLITGSEKNKADKIFLEMTGGTEGSKKVYARLSQAGVNTIVAMHLSEEHFKIAKQEHINIIIAGHMASDNLGLNLLLDEVEKVGKERFNVIECSGFVRVKER